MDLYSQVDPLQKREDFAVSLRKSKKQKILTAKRIKMHKKKGYN